MLAIPRPSPPQRLLSLALVALLHALALFALLHFLVQRQSPGTAAPERLLEMIISTAPRPVPVARPAPAPRRKPVPALPSPGGEPSNVMPAPAPPVAPPDMTGFGQALFGCAPENLMNLSPDQRAHCHNGFTRPDEETVIEPRSHVKDPARREAEMRTRNTPGRVPCTSFMMAPAPHGAVLAPEISPACIIGGLLNGFGPLNGLSK